ncbi:MAG: hypothetical protein EZS28_020376 [Streblomastix strix]|uniref:Tyr recombinase domain-containing protein n=1 Tax=Streblomastix strix TaxID=222440 RepID=A0A5J4VP71_9EUKA|nr:MAG: hypothetical protein EZS28_020376 [Streblomastix strix]
MRLIIKNNKKSIPFDVLFKRREGDVYPVKAIEQWFNQEDCTKQVQEGVWCDFKRKKKLGSFGCSQVLRYLQNDIGNNQQFGGSTVRHAMMTKLRREEATIKEVNDFTIHQEGSSCVDNFYIIQIARDLGAILLKEPKVYLYIIYMDILKSIIKIGAKNSMNKREQSGELMNEKGIEW